MNTIGRFSTGIANIAFTKVVTIPAGQTVVLPIKINVNNTADVASELRISLLEVKSDTALAGSFPMVGNAFTIANADLGTLEFSKSGDAPSASINAGDTNVKLAKFDLVTANEAQTIKRIVLTQNGTAADTDIANLKLVDDDGTVLALGQLDRNKVIFDLNRDCISGTTARLTVRGDVVGGAGRTIEFTLDNVNDVQSIGKIYGTTIVASGTLLRGAILEIGQGAFLLSRANSSPAAATVATTTDDQKFAAIKIQAIGEPVQLETITVCTKVNGFDYNGYDENGKKIDDEKDKAAYNAAKDAIKEVKLVSNGIIIASQDIRKDIGVEKLLLPLNEVVTVEPNSPITIDILVDLKDSTSGNKYEMGIGDISGIGLVSGKDVISREVDEDGKLKGDMEVSYGNTMTVGTVKVTFTQKAQLDGYVFQNQSEETFAEFTARHNLGERVRLSSITFEFGAKDKDNAIVAEKDIDNVIKSTFKNLKVVSGNTVLSNSIQPTGKTVTISLNEGVIIEPGKTLRLGLVGDIKDKAQAGYQFEIYVTNATAVTAETGTKVDISGSEDDSRTITVSAGIGANGQDISVQASKEANLKNKNILAKDTNVEIARWTIENPSEEDIGINKVYLTASYSGQIPNSGEIKNLKKASISFVLKDGDGKTLTDTSELFTIDKGTEVEILKQNNRSVFVVDAAKDGENGKKDLVLYANVADRAQVGGTISVALGKETSTSTAIEKDGKYYYVKAETGEIIPYTEDEATANEATLICKNGAPVKCTQKTIEYFEMTGRITGKTSTFEKTEVGIKNKGTGEEPKYEYEYKLVEAGTDGKLVNTIAISKVVAVNVLSSERTVKANDTTGSKWVAGGAVAKFAIKNEGKTTVTVDQIAVKLGKCPEEEGVPVIKNLELYDTSGKVSPASGDVSYGKVEPDDSDDPIYYAIFKLGKDIKIKAGESEEFTLRNKEDLPVGTIELSIDKNMTFTDTASHDGYQIALDNEKDSISLGSLTVEANKNS